MDSFVKHFFFESQCYNKRRVLTAKDLYFVCCTISTPNPWIATSSKSPLPQKFLDDNNNLGIDMHFNIFNNRNGENNNNTGFNPPSPIVPPTVIGVLHSFAWVLFFCKWWAKEQENKKRSEHEVDTERGLQNDDPSQIERRIAERERVEVKVKRMR